MTTRRHNAIAYSKDPAPRDRQIIARFGNGPGDYPVKARFVFDTVIDGVPSGAWRILGRQGAIEIVRNEPVEWRDVPKRSKKPAQPHSTGGPYGLADRS